MAIDITKPDYAKNMRFVGQSDQGGRPDAVQVMVEKGFAYVGHLFSQGFSVIDVRDPKKPVPVEYVPCPDNTWNLHLQAADDLLLVVHARNMWAQPELADERNYYKGKADFHATAHSKGERNWSAGLAVYDISTPGKPKQIGFMPVEGGGLHRAWYAGGRWAYASALIDGFTDYIFITIDMSDPKNPREAGRFWLPGMNHAAGETAELADGERPLRLPSRRGQRRRRLLRLARRRNGDRRRQRPQRPEADRAQELVAALRRRHA